jgi:hypothetical protein
MRRLAAALVPAAVLAAFALAGAPPAAAECAHEGGKAARTGGKAACKDGTYGKDPVEYGDKPASGSGGGPLGGAGPMALLGGLLG